MMHEAFSPVLGIETAFSQTAFSKRQIGMLFHAWLLYLQSTTRRHEANHANTATTGNDPCAPWIARMVQVAGDRPEEQMAAMAPEFRAFTGTPDSEAQWVMRYESLGLPPFLEYLFHQHSLLKELRMAFKPIRDPRQPLSSDNVRAIVERLQFWMLHAFDVKVNVLGFRDFTDRNTLLDPVSNMIDNFKSEYSTSRYHVAIFREEHQWVYVWIDMNPVQKNSSSSPKSGPHFNYLHNARKSWTFDPHTTNAQGVIQDLLDLFRGVRSVLSSLTPLQHKVIQQLTSSKTSKSKSKSKTDASSKSKTGRRPVCLDMVTLATFVHTLSKGKGQLFENQSHTSRKPGPRRKASKKDSVCSVVGIRLFTNRTDDQLGDDWKRPEQISEAHLRLVAWLVLSLVTKTIEAIPTVASNERMRSSLQAFNGALFDRRSTARDLERVIGNVEEELIIALPESFQYFGVANLQEHMEKVVFNDPFFRELHQRPGNGEVLMGQVYDALVVWATSSFSTSNGQSLFPSNSVVVSPEEQQQFLIYATTLKNAMIHLLNVSSPPLRLDTQTTLKDFLIHLLRKSGKNVNYYGYVVVLLRELQRWLLRELTRGGQSVVQKNPYYPRLPKEFGDQPPSDLVSPFTPVTQVDLQQQVRQCQTTLQRATELVNTLKREALIPGVPQDPQVSRVMPMPTTGTGTGTTGITNDTMPRWIPSATPTSFPTVPAFGPVTPQIPSSSFPVPNPISTPTLPNTSMTASTGTYATETLKSRYVQALTADVTRGNWPASTEIVQPWQCPVVLKHVKPEFIVQLTRHNPVYTQPEWNVQSETELKDLLEFEPYRKLLELLMVQADINLVSRFSSWERRTGSFYVQLLIIALSQWVKVFGQSSFWAYLLFRWHNTLKNFSDPYQTEVPQYEGDDSEHRKYFYMLQLQSNRSF